MLWMERARHAIGTWLETTAETGGLRAQGNIYDLGHPDGVKHLCVERTRVEGLDVWMAGAPARSLCYVSGSSSQLAVRAESAAYPI